jgi:hypothetical protein
MVLPNGGNVSFVSGGFDVRARCIAFIDEYDARRSGRTRRNLFMAIPYESERRA